MVSTGSPPLPLVPSEIGPLPPLPLRMPALAVGAPLVAAPTAPVPEPTSPSTLPSAVLPSLQPMGPSASSETPTRPEAIQTFRPIASMCVWQACAAALSTVRSRKIARCKAGISRRLDIRSDSGRLTEGGPAWRLLRGTVTAKTWVDMSRQSVTVLATAIALLALVAGFFALRPSAPAPVTQRREQQQTMSAAEASASTLPVNVPSFAPAASATAASATAVTALDEPALMQKLRELRSTDPVLTLALAREGNERFKGSADAAERAWFVVKALTDLGRHDEARVEGRSLVDTYRDTRWAEDVYRHLFVNPGTHPFE